MLNSKPVKIEGKVYQLPNKKIATPRMQLHPEAIVSLGVTFDRKTLMCKPFVEFFMEGMEETVNVDLSSFGINALSCQMDFLTDVASCIDQSDVIDLDFGDQLASHLILRALLKNATLLICDLSSTSKNGKRRMFGQIELLARAGARYGLDFNTGDPLAIELRPFFPTEARK